MLRRTEPGSHGGFNFPWHWFYAGPTRPTQVSLFGCAVCHFPISVLSSHTTRTEPPGRWKLVNGKLVKRIFLRNENRIPFWATTARRTPTHVRVPQKKWRDVEPPPKHGVYLKARNGNVYLDWYCFERKIRVFVVEEVEALNRTQNDDKRRV